MKKSFLSLLAAIALVSLATHSYASQWCTGQVQSVLVGYGGNVEVLATFRSDWLMVCSLGGTWKGVPADTCKAWLGVLTTLRVSHDNVLVAYFDDTPCSSIASYESAPAPAYVALAAP